MPKKLTKTDSYRTLVSKISQELSQLEFFLKQRTAVGHWKIGKYIHEHLLANKERAKYGTTFYERLAKDVDRDVSTLQRSVQFYRAYPIPVLGRELTWGHYRRLMTVKDKSQRKKLEDQILQRNWDTHKVQEYLNTKRELAATGKDDRPVVQLTFTRGRLSTYPIAYANKTFVERSPLVLDLGFRQQYLIPKTAARFKEGDHAEIVFEKGDLSGVRKIDGLKTELFTYLARVEKIIDGDTFLVAFDFHLEVSISQKLRLRGIDCPEIETEEGKRAKRFVEARLKGCDFIIVKTYKDRSDKFDRYLADVFYKAGESDPAVVAKEGTYLNQELLNERLVRPWP